VRRKGVESCPNMILEGHNGHECYDGVPGPPQR
jgi:hypothetical protein